MGSGCDLPQKACRSGFRADVTNAFAIQDHFHVENFACWDFLVFGEGHQAHTTSARTMERGLLLLLSEETSQAIFES